MLLPVMESAGTSSAYDSKACMEVALCSPITLLLFRYAKRLGPASPKGGCRDGGGGRKRLQQQEWEREWKASLLF